MRKTKKNHMQSTIPIRSRVPRAFTATTVAALGLLAIVAAPVQAGDIDGDVRVGVYTDASEGFVGGGIITGLGGGDWFFNPNVEFVFVDPGDLTTLNLDFHYDLDTRGAVDVWLGGGPALVFREGPRGNDETDAGLNLLGGVGFLRDQSIRPYVQGKILVSDDTEAVLAFGIRFF